MLTLPTNCVNTNSIGPEIFARKTLIESEKKKIVLLLTKSLKAKT